MVTGNYYPGGVMSSNYAEQAAVIAEELGSHIDDLVDQHLNIEGESGSFIPHDTSITGEANSFYVTMSDTSRYKVTVEHVPDVIDPNSFAVTMFGAEPTIARDDRRWDDNGGMAEVRK